MAIRIRCPKCNTEYSINPMNAGKRTECKVCGQEMRVPAAARPVPEPVSAPASEWHNEPAVERPPEPHREPEPEPQREREPERDYRDDPEPLPRRWSRPRERENERAGSSSGRTAWVIVLRVVAIVVWVVTLLATGVIGLWWISAMNRAETVFQECAISASTAAWLIGIYIAARSAEKILAAVTP